MDFLVPATTLPKLSFCKTDPEHFKQWIKSLPVADISNTAKQLYLALDELIQLDVNPKLRYQMAVAILPLLQHVQTALRPRYLNQPIIMADKPRTIANLSISLELKATILFLSITQDTEQQMRRLFKKPYQLLNQSIFHVFQHLFNILTIQSALYRNTSKGIFLQLHKLYEKACSHNVQLDKKTLEESINPDYLNIEQMYTMCMLWGRLNTNQLQQQAILNVSKQIAKWQDFIYIEAAKPSVDNLIIPHDKDMPPVYQQHLDEMKDDYLMLNTKPLVNHLSSDTPKGININTAKTLINAWGHSAARAAARMPSTEQITICIGLSAIHQQLCGQLSLTEIAYGRKSHIELHQLVSDFANRRAKVMHDKGNMSKDLDVWSLNQSPSFSTNIGEGSLGGLSLNGGREELKARFQTGSSSKNYQTHTAEAVDVSASGYCLQWRGDAPENIKAGELIAILTNEDAGTWHLADIRWVKQLPNTGKPTLQAGVALLSPNPTAISAYSSDKQGMPLTDYFRALMLPAVPALQQPATVITPALSFTGQQKLILSSNGHEKPVKLAETINASSHYIQSAYQDIEETLAQKISSVNMKDYSGISLDKDFDEPWDALK